jgi:hypothetical protein
MNAMISEVPPPFDPTPDGPAEMLFSVQMMGCPGYVYLVFVTDHAQMQDMPFRMLTAFVRIWDRHRAEHQDHLGHPGPLPLIVASVISTVPGGWTGPLTLHDLCKPHPRGVPGLSEWIPNVSLRVRDLTRTGNETPSSSTLFAL